jgi:hypothetical protein
MEAIQVLLLEGLVAVVEARVQLSSYLPLAMAGLVELPVSLLGTMVWRELLRLQTLELVVEVAAPEAEDLLPLERAARAATAEAATSSSSGSHRREHSLATKENAHEPFLVR